MRQEYFGQWLGVVRPRLAWSTAPEAGPDGAHGPGGAA
jgi:hypothetical protein